MHVGVARGDHPLGGTVLKVDTHVRALSHIDSDDADATGVFVGDVIDHLGIAEDVSKVGFSLLEGDF